MYDVELGTCSCIAIDFDVPLFLGGSSCMLHFLQHAIVEEA